MFGDNGAYSNCWCTWWLLTANEFDQATPRERRELLRTEVSGDREPGLIAYRGDAPVGWCAVGPRHRYGRLNSRRSRTYRPIDDLETWVVSCFFVSKAERGTGIATALLRAAIEYARSHGAVIVEGYPRDLQATPARAPDLFVGTLSMFRAAGFQEAHRVHNRPLVRLVVEQP